MNLTPAEAFKLAGGQAAAVEPEDAEVAKPTETIDGEVLADFGGALRRFRLTVPHLAKVERDCEAGPAIIAGALARCVQVLSLNGKGVSPLALIAAGLGDWRTSYVRQVLFHGLRGGGMDEPQVARLIREEIDERGFMGLLERAELAFGVITGAYVGPQEDPPAGEPEGAARKAAPKPRKRRSRTAARASA